MSQLIGNYGRYGVSFVKGEGCRLYDEQGSEYLDFGCGISVVNLGHSHPAVSKAVAEQAGTLIHTSNLYGNPLQEELGRRLSELSTGGRVFFCNSGAEANEAAIKLARIYGNRRYEGLRHRVITMKNSFHGRTYATLSATGQEKIHEGFRPIADFFTHVPMNDFESVRRIADSGDVAAIMVELWQGEGGVIPIERGFLERLRAYCTKKDILLIFDEIQTGIGRTGRMFGYEHFGVEPDIMTVAKALGNGVPIGAAVARGDVAEYFIPGTHGTTFGGNYLACAAGIAVLDAMDEDFLKGVRETGRYMKDRLKEIFPSPKFTVRGEGMLLGVQFEERMADFVKACMEEKLLVLPAGHETMRVYPPLNIDRRDLDEGLARMEKVLAGGEF
ncbi:aspartate aminotransferase family protein [Limisalsivibrio acetivorans]|uniref:aspartate aminotransferase family protein n=1 Tax=Limisalsivibrio acetivorans TaxID=1304888 RepID=UPI0003B3BB1C|nr:aspartate aminotransferase family protein [Limisalsivibrio acetivorans]